MINIEINNIPGYSPPEIRVWRGTEDIAGNTPSPERFALVWKEECFMGVFDASKETGNLAGNESV